MCARKSISRRAKGWAAALAAHSDAAAADCRQMPRRRPAAPPTRSARRAATNWPRRVPIGAATSKWSRRQVCGGRLCEQTRRDLFASRRAAALIVVIDFAPPNRPPLACEGGRRSPSGGQQQQPPSASSRFAELISEFARRREYQYFGGGGATSSPPAACALPVAALIQLTWRRLIIEQDLAPPSRRGESLRPATRRAAPLELYCAIAIQCKRAIAIERERRRAIEPTELVRRRPFNSVSSQVGSSCVANF